LDSNYYLLDATWESNTLGQTDLFKGTYRSDYFLTHPELFVKNHLPSNSYFQLLACPVTFDQFMNGTGSTNKGEDCLYNFKDSIDHFLLKSYPDQKIIESASVYRQYPHEKNESAWGHAIVDKAILLKESADGLFESGKYEGAHAQYEESLSYFLEGSGKASLYRWQVEAYAFCHLNYAQVDYRLNRQSRLAISRVAHHLRESRSRLNQLNSNSTTIKNALSQIENQLAAIE
jgi:hypothetical protein